MRQLRQGAHQRGISEAVAPSAVATVALPMAPPSDETATHQEGRAATPTPMSQIELPTAEPISPASADTLTHMALGDSFCVETDHVLPPTGTTRTEPVLQRILAEVGITPDSHLQ